MSQESNSKEMNDGYGILSSCSKCLDKQNKTSLNLSDLPDVIKAWILGIIESWTIWRWGKPIFL